jgi:hypothetical protein
MFATEAGAQIRSAESRDAARSTAGTSTWSSCWCVISTLSTPSSAASTSEKEPGSITKARSPSSSRTHE